MIHGHITRNSRSSAAEEIQSNPSQVICLECGQVAKLHTLDYGFSDDFGGVTDYRVMTDCCDSTEWTKGCSSCGEVKPLLQLSDKCWYCAECKKELEEEANG